MDRIILCEPRVTHQVIDLIGQLYLLIRIFQSFVIILKHRSGLGLGYGSLDRLQLLIVC